MNLVLSRGFVYNIEIFLLILALVSYYVIGILTGKIFAETVRFPSGAIDFHTSTEGGKRTRFPRFILAVIGAILAFLLIGSLVGSSIFRAKTYSSLITVEDADFASGIAETEYVTDIALMDTASARIIGARTLGTLSDLVSQYNVSYSYTQIAMQNAKGESHPYKVAPLEYASFFKWIQNKAAGIPGYVKVDTVKFEAEFVRLPLNLWASAGTVSGLLRVRNEAEIQNPGDGPCGVVVTFRAEGGAVVHPSVTAGGKYIRCPLTLADGDEMEIDTRPRRKTITVNGERVFLFDRDSTFFQLPPGMTPVTVGADEGEDYLKARIAFTPIYYGM